MSILRHPFGLRTSLRWHRLALAGYRWWVLSSQPSRNVYTSNYKVAERESITISMCCGCSMFNAGSYKSGEAQSNVLTTLWGSWIATVISVRNDQRWYRWLFRGLINLTFSPGLFSVRWIWRRPLLITSPSEFLFFSTTHNLPLYAPISMIHSALTFVARQQLSFWCALDAYIRRMTALSTIKTFNSFWNLVHFKTCFIISLNLFKRRSSSSTTSILRTLVTCDLEIVRADMQNISLIWCQGSV